MSASLIAKLQLDIAGYQAALAKSSGDLEAYKQRSIKQVDAIGAAQKRLNESAGARSIIDGRLQLRLLEARIAGNDKEVRQLEQRQQLLMQMRQIQRDTGVSQREAYSLSQRLGPGGSMGGAGGGKGYAMGMAAMQAQDIAVQLQMGASSSTIIAQQGSQLLSIFGTGGMLLGGIAAVAAMFYTMQSKASEALQALNNEVGDFDEKLQGLKAKGITDMLQGMDEMKTRADEAREAIGQFSLNRFFSKTTYDSNGKASNAYDAANDDIGATNEQGRLELEKEIVIQAEKQAEVARLRAAGLDAEADKMEENIRLAQLWRKISQTQWATPEGRDAYKKASEDIVLAERQQREAEAAKKISDAQAKLDETRNRASDEQLDLSQKIEKVKQEIAAPSAVNSKDPVAKIEEETKRVELQMQLNDLLKEQESLAHQAAEDARRNQKDEERALKTKKEEIAQLQKQEAQRNINRENLKMDLEVLRLRAAGRNKAADKMQRERDIAEDAARIRKETGASPEQALESAKERARLQDRINRRESGQPGQRGHIYGVQGEGRRMGSAGGGGLSEFSRMQQNGYSNSLGDRGKRSIPGHYMGGYEGSLADRAKRANGAQDASEKDGDSGLGLVGKILTMLTRLTTTVAG